MDAELAGLARSIEDARKRGDEPRAKALEARVARVRAKLAGAPIPPEPSSELGQLAQSIEQARSVGDEPRAKALEERAERLRSSLADAPTARLPDS